jgi:hypothetical protein
MDQPWVYYRVGLIEAVNLLVLLVLAFGSLTLLTRNRLQPLGIAESLLARLSASLVVAAIGVGGLSGVTLNLLRGALLSDDTTSLAASRNQALIGIALALALTIVAIIRIEVYHRGGAERPIEEDEERDWKVEPPDLAGRR